MVPKGHRQLLVTGHQRTGGALGRDGKDEELSRRKRLLRWDGAPRPSLPVRAEHTDEAGPDEYSESHRKGNPGPFTVTEA